MAGAGTYLRAKCPKCESAKVWRNGFKGADQRYRCGKCRHIWVLERPPEATPEEPPVNLVIEPGHELVPVPNILQKYRYVMRNAKPSMADDEEMDFYKKLRRQNPEKWAAMVNAEEHKYLAMVERERVRRAEAGESASGGSVSEDTERLVGLLDRLLLEAVNA